MSASNMHSPCAMFSSAVLNRRCCSLSSSAAREEPAAGKPAMQHRLVCFDPTLEIGEEFFRARLRPVKPVLEAVADEVDQRRSGWRFIRSKTVELEVAPVAHDDAPVLVEHAQAVRYVLQRGV